MFERFTAGARGVVIGAQQEARDLRHPMIGTEHVLLALVSDPQTPVARLLAGHGLDAATVRAEIRRRVGEPEPEPDLAVTDADAEDAAALLAIGIDLNAVRAAIEENFGPGSLRLPKNAPKKRGLFGRFYAPSGGAHLRFSPRNKKVLELSLREALRLGHNFIAPEHIALGLLREGQGLAARILADRGIEFGPLRAELTALLNAEAA